MGRIPSPPDAGDTATVAVRAATYCRVSTEDQARDGYGLPDQRARTAALVHREGWRLADGFEDAGVLWQ